MLETQIGNFNIIMITQKQKQKENIKVAAINNKIGEWESVISNIKNNFTTIRQQTNISLTCSDLKIFFNIVGLA